MEPAAIYIGSETAHPFSREALIYENAEAAVARVVSVERHLVTRKDNALGRSAPGLADIITENTVVALGKLAHTLLANYPKRSLLASDVDMDEDEHGVDDLEQFIWSCANTSRVVAVGGTAWRNVQMLPVADLRKYDVPPLKLPPSRAGIRDRRIFIINHDQDDRQARELGALAIVEGFSVACSGFSSTHRDQHILAQHSFVCAEPEIHVHVGHHTASSKAFRLTDSWHSGRLAVQLAPARGSIEQRGTDYLLVDDEVNGFSCRTAEAAIAICRDAQQDHVLSRKLIGSGHRTAEQLTHVWSLIAQDLLV